MIAGLLRSSLLVGFLALGVSGCAQLATMEQTKRLEETVKFYVKSVRWNRMNETRSMLRDRDGKPITVDLKPLKGLQVTSYDYSVSAATAAAGEAIMTVSFDYYFDATSTLKTVEQQALWWWDAGTETWFMDDTLPAFKR